MVIEHCFSVSVALSLAACRLAPSPAPRGPSRPRLCCCYDPAAVAAPIWSRNATGGAAPPFSPIAFPISFHASRAKNRLPDAHSKKTDSGSNYINNIIPY